MKKNISWDYVLKVLNKMFLDEQIREIPVFFDKLGNETLGEFRFTQTGINAIILSSNSNLTDRQMIGVLLHEMVHQLVFEKHGILVEEHGEEWLSEIKKIGFSEEDLCGLNFCSKDLYYQIMHQHDKLLAEH